MATAPFQPQNVTAEQTDGNILIGWTASLGANNYQIQRSIDGVNFSDLVIVGQVSQYVDSYPGVGIKYWYQVSAVTTLSTYATATFFFGGQPSNGESFVLNNKRFIVGTDFFLGATVAQTIQNAATVVNATDSFKYIVTASASPTILTFTSVVPGVAGNLIQVATDLSNTSSDDMFSNGINPVQSPYSSIVSIVAAPPGEMSLGELRLRSQQTADRVDSEYVTNDEWNAFLRIAMYELYDILTTTYEDYNVATPVYINTNGSQMQYNLPNGLNYQGNTLGSTSGIPAPRLYKLSGIDLGVNTSNNAWVTLHRFDWIDRNQYVYPNSTSTIYGVYNMRYRPIGTNTYTQALTLIPTPAGNQQLRIWYAPVLPALLSDIDLTTIGFSGWLRYVIVRAAKYALDKEGSDSSKLDTEIIFLKQRITESASNRDMGQAETISNTRRDPVYGGSGWMDGGSNAGY